MKTPPVLSLRSLCKRFTEAAWVIDDISLDVQRGELLCILGPSGCGKTTLLRLIAGFEVPDRGEVLWQGEPISNAAWVLPPERRRIGMVFQDGALFPHLTVIENVRFGLIPPWTIRWRQPILARTPGCAPAAERPLEELLRLAGLTDLAHRYPHELSGGQQQRVALARALAPQPNLVLLDEPFSNQDAALRRRIRDDMRQVLHAAGTTAILVTHDQEEAVNVADRLAVMNQGRIEQVGPPEEVLAQPATGFVARFVGRNGFLRGQPSAGAVRTELGEFPLPGAAPPHGNLEVLVRPGQVQRDGSGGVTARVLQVEFLAGQSLYTLALPSGATIPALLPGDRPLHVGDRVPIRFQPDPLVVYPAE